MAAARRPGQLEGGSELADPARSAGEAEESSCPLSPKPLWRGSDGAELEHECGQATVQTPPPRTTVDSPTFSDDPLLPNGYGGFLSQSGAEPHDDAGDPPWRKFAVKLVVTIAVFVGLVLGLHHFAEERVSKVSKAIMKSIGLPGLFLFVFLADGTPQPFTYVPLIFIAVQGDVAKHWVFTTCAVASYAAALTGYFIGSMLRSASCGQTFFMMLSRDYPYVPQLMQRQGAVGVAVAALLPVPLAIATWTAGLFSIDYKRFLLAACCRCPKIFVFVLLSPSPLQKAVELRTESVMTLIA